LVSINLAANGLSEIHGPIIAKIVQTHQQKKDELKWLRSLRSDNTDFDKIRTLKQLILAHNELCGSGIKDIARVIKNDTYLRCLDFRGNRILAKEIDELYSSFKENDTLFNVDLRENPGLSEKMARTFALKMLANYTRISNES
jgi:hypothetical protein